jgi:hypothetical protein
MKGFIRGAFLCAVPVVFVLGLTYPMSSALSQSCGGGGCGRIETCGEGEAWNPDDCACEPASPVILDTNGQGFQLTSAANGVLFDMQGSGQKIKVAWTAGNSGTAFLALPGSDRLADDGKELFGNFTPQPSSNHRNGFAALAVYDLPQNGGNGDGIIDARDKIFSSLRLWLDSNHDGVSQPEELRTLPSLGVNSISLHYHPSMYRDQYGNLFRYKSKVNPGDPNNSSDVGRAAFDVFFTTAN